MYAIREALAAFRRAPVLTGLSAAMVGLALFVVGLFALASYNLHLALSAIEEQGPPQEVFANPRSQRFRQFLEGNLK